MAIKVSNDLQALLKRYAALEAGEKTDAQKLKEVEGQIATQVAQVDLTKLQTQLPPAELETFKSIAKKDSFEKSFYSWGGDIALLRENFSPKSAEEAQAQRTQAVGSQLTQRAENNAQAKVKGEPVATLGQKMVDNQVAGPDGLAPAMKSFIDQLKPSKFKREIEAEWQKLSAALTNKQIEAEGFQSPQFKQVMAHLSGERSNLSKAQKTALNNAFPANEALRAEFVKIATAGLQGDERKAIETLGAAKTTADLTDDQKQQVAALASGFDPAAASAAAAAGATAGAAAAAALPEYTGTLTRAYAMTMPEPARMRAMEFVEAREKFERQSAQTHMEVMSLLNSGLPIEMIIMLVMSRMSERHEEKQKLLMKEQAFNEQLGAQIQDLSKSLDERKAAGVTVGVDHDQKVLDGLKQIPLKSTNLMNNEVQQAMQQFSQLTQALGSIMKMLQDMAMNPIRNLR